MPRKPFENQPYNPIEADLVRDAAASNRTLGESLGGHSRRRNS